MSTACCRVRCVCLSRFCRRLVKTQQQQQQQHLGTRGAENLHCLLLLMKTVLPPSPLLLLQFTSHRSSSSTDGAHAR